MAFKDRFYDVPVLGTALRVQDRYKDDTGDQFAASIGFFGFLSLFPLIALGVAVGGFVMRNTPGANLDVAQAISDAIPGLGGGVEGVSGIVDTVAKNAGAIGGISFVLLLLSGLRVVNSAMTATSKFFRVELPTGVKLKLRQLGALALLGTLALVATVVSSLAGFEFSFVPHAVTVAVSTLVTLALDVLLFLVAYRILVATEGPAWGDLLPGALLAGAGWTALKVFGSTFLASKAASANELYGLFGGIIALLALFYLAGRLYVYGAELSVVLRRVDERTGSGPGASPDDDGRSSDGRDGADRLAGSVDERTLPASDDRPVGDGRGAGHAEARGVPSGESDADRSDASAMATERSRSLARASRTPSPAVTEATRARLAEADARRDPDAPAPVRHAIAFTLAIGAVGGLVVATRPWERDD